MKKFNEETEFQKAKTDSLIMAFSISIIISIGLSYVNIGIWWGKLLFEIGSKLFVFFVSWKFLAKFILSMKVKNWEKANSDKILKGQWYVIHYSDEKKFKHYLRYGEVKLTQNMDEYTIKGQNYSMDNHSTKKRHSAWISASPYRLSINNVLAGEFDVESSDGRRNSDGLHNLIVDHNLSIMRGMFFNVKDINPNEKPRTGNIVLYRNEQEAMEEYERLKREHNIGDKL